MVAGFQQNVTKFSSDFLLGKANQQEEQKLSIYDKNYNANNVYFKIG